MAKWKRSVIGSIVKGKDGKPDYLKVSKDVVLKEGDYLNLESKAAQLKSLEEAEANGKLGGDMLESIREKVNKMPDFVRFHVVRLEKQD
jgi:hypothetical protein